jgi:serine phosphatase RsbU (regulator of sigma subunit)
VTETRPAHGARTATAGPTRVLLVEDDEGDAFLVRELLLDVTAETEIQHVRTLADAVAALPGATDCVLLDLGLPDAQDMDALGAVLEAAPSIACIVLTGLTDEHRGTEAVAVGAQDYLVKGSTDGQLLSRSIRYAVERKRADESMRRLYASEARAAENARLERGLLPQPLISDHGLRVASRYRPGGHQSLLGGDFFDVVECEDGSVYALIGDVAGHGPDEAALGVALRIAWRTLVLSGADPETLLDSMEAVLVSERGSDEVFATVSMARISPDRSLARFWLAGHPLPGVIGAEGISPLPEDAAGIALGVLPGAQRPGVDVDLPPDARLLMFTDGLIEGFARPGGPERLGETGLFAIASDLLSHRLDDAGFADALLAHAQSCNGGALTDDVAVLVLSWAGR